MACCLISWTHTLLSWKYLYRAGKSTSQGLSYRYVALDKAIVTGLKEDIEAAVNRWNLTNEPPRRKYTIEQWYEEEGDV